MSFPIPLAFLVDSLGGSEMAFIFLIVLVLFGGKKLPEFARGLGKSIREFKKAAAGVEEEFKRALEEDERAQKAKPVLTTAPTPAALPAATTPATETPLIEDDYHAHHPEPTMPAPAPDTSTPSAVPPPDASLITPPPPPAPDTPPPAPDHPPKHP